MRSMNALDWIAMIILVLGGLNWGLIGFFGIDALAMIFGAGTIISRIAYAIVGLSALYVLIVGVIRSSATTAARYSQPVTS